tara:strand:- start:1009 stop:1212 length:204 start_codon:yes stop_codon:yes gene_type:complete
MKAKEIQELSDLHLEIKLMEGNVKTSENLALLPFYDPSIHRTLREEKNKLQALKMAYNDKINNLTKY